MKQEITAFSISDTETERIMRECYKNYQYITDPHGAVGIAGWNRFRKDHTDGVGIVLETAHPAKFIEIVESVLKISIPLPEQLSKLANKNKSATAMNSEFDELKEYLMERSRS